LAGGVEAGDGLEVDGSGPETVADVLRGDVGRGSVGLVVGVERCVRRGALVAKVGADAEEGFAGAKDGVVGGGERLPRTAFFWSSNVREARVSWLTFKSFKEGCKAGNLLAPTVKVTLLRWKGVARVSPAPRRYSEGRSSQ
jgi:hypothetical protein